MQNIKAYRFYITQLQPTYLFLLSLFGGLLRVIVIPVVFVLNHQGQSIKMFLFGHMENLFYVYTTADNKIIEFVPHFITSLLSVNLITSLPMRKSLSMMRRRL